MGKLDVIERAANRLLQHNVAEARIAIELMQESHDQRGEYPKVCVNLQTDVR